MGIQSFHHDRPAQAIPKKQLRWSKIGENVKNMSTDCRRGGGGGGGGGPMVKNCEKL